MTPEHTLAARLAAVATATRTADVVSPERARAVMDERARRLARVESVAPAAGEVTGVVCLAVGDERYGIEMRWVREVIPVGEITPVPGTPDVWLGVTNRRGEFLAVVDLARLLGVGRGQVSARSRIVVLGDGRADLGVLGDAVPEVTSLRTADLLDVETGGDGAARAYLRGVSRDGLVLLDGALLLGDAGLFVGKAGG